MILENLRDLIGQIEALATDAVAKAAPWAAPIPTAYLVGRATVEHLRWPNIVGFVAAVIVESLGLATTVTALELRNYNQEKRKSDPQAPFTVAAVLVAVYLVVAVGLTVALDIAPVLAVYSPAVFPLLSLCGVTVLALRGDHRRRLEAIAEDKRRRSGSRSSKRSGTGQGDGRGDQSGAFSLGNLNRANEARRVSREEALNGLLEHFGRDPNASYSEVGRSVGRSKSWVAGAVSELEAAGRLIRNNGQVKVLNCERSDLL